MICRKPGSSATPGLRGVIERFRWALRCPRRPRSPVALLRMLWADFVIHPLFEDGERCEDCGRSYVCWRAPDVLWMTVVKSRRHLFCPLCFDQRAERLGIVVWFQAHEGRPTAEAWEAAGL